jgi:hypothetical protein
MAYRKWTPGCNCDCLGCRLFLLGVNDAGVVTGVSDTETAVMRHIHEDYVNVVDVVLVPPIFGFLEQAKIIVPPGGLFRMKQPIPITGGLLDFYAESNEAYNGRFTCRVGLTTLDDDDIDSDDSIVYEWGSDFESLYDPWTQFMSLKSDWLGSGDFPQGAIPLTHQRGPSATMTLYRDSVEIGSLATDTVHGLNTFHSGSMGLHSPIWDVMNRPVRQNVPRYVWFQNTGETDVHLRRLIGNQITDIRIPQTGEMAYTFFPLGLRLKCDLLEPLNAGTVGNTPFWIEAELDVEGVYAEPMADSGSRDLVVVNPMPPGIPSPIATIGKKAIAETFYIGSTGVSGTSGDLYSGARIQRIGREYPYGPVLSPSDVWPHTHPDIEGSVNVAIDDLLTTTYSYVTRPLSLRVGFGLPRILTVDHTVTPWRPLRCESVVSIQVARHGYWVSVLPNLGSSTHAIIRTSSYDWTTNPSTLILGRRILRLTVQFDAWERGNMPELVVPWDVEEGDVLGAYTVISVVVWDEHGSPHAREQYTVEQTISGGSTNYTLHPVLPGTPMEWVATIRQSLQPVVPAP